MTHASEQEHCHGPACDTVITARRRWAALGVFRFVELCLRTDRRSHRFPPFLLRSRARLVPFGIDLYR